MAVQISVLFTPLAIPRHDYLSKHVSKKTKRVRKCRLASAVFSNPLYPLACGGPQKRFDAALGPDAEAKSSDTRAVRATSQVPIPGHWKC